MNITSEKIRSGLLILSWALYDLANQFFALNVVSLYFARWLILEKKAPEIFYSISFGISIFFVAILAPVLGAISDEVKRRKPFLVYLTFISIIFTMLLGIAKNIFLGLLFFAIANFGCQLAIVFYNALMVNITPRDKIGLVSGIGRMFSYIGAILALYLVRPALLKGGYQATFLPTAFLFLVFSLPCMILIKDTSKPKLKISLPISLFKNKVSIVFKQLLAVVFGNYNPSGLSDFLKATFWGMCSVNVVIVFMSVYATRVFKLDEYQVINLVAFSTLFAIAGSLFSGMLSDFLGYRHLLAIVFLLWIICFFLGAFAKTVTLYWIIGALVGIALGSTWVVARALVMRLTPEEKIGEVFGMFNLVGYLSAIIGVLFWGLVLFIFSPFGEWSYRIALLSLIFFMSLGFIFLLRIPEKIKNK